LGGFKREEASSVLSAKLCLVLKWSAGPLSESGAKRERERERE